MNSARALCHCVMLLLTGGPLLLASHAAIAQDADGDGIPDEVERRIGTDPARGERFEIIFDDKAQGKGDTTISRGRRLAPDILDLSVANVAGNRYVWRIRFAADFASEGTVLILYVDADGDRGTGRQDKEGVRGTDIMYNVVNGRGGIQVHTNGIRERPELPPRWAIVADAVYFSDDLHLAQAGGRTQYRAYVLCHRQDPTSDSDVTPWTVVRCAGDSERLKPPLPFPENEGFAALPAWHELTYALKTAPGAVRLPLEGADLKGFVLQGDGDILAGAEEGASATLTVARTGRYYLAFELYDQPGAVEGIEVSRNGERIGTAAGFSPVRRRILFHTTRAIDVKKGDALQLRLAHATTNARLGGVLLLKKEPEPPALRIEHAATYLPIPDPGEEPVVAICWTTNRPAHGSVTLEVGGERFVVEEGRGTVNNHRVFLRQRLEAAGADGEKRTLDLAGLMRGESYEVRIQAWEEPDPQRLFPPQRAESEPIRVTGRRPQPKRAKPQRVELTVSEPTSVARKAWPVTSGVPLPQGALDDATRVQIIGPDGSPVLAQSRALAYWPDGSVKWLLADFAADTRADDVTTYVLRLGVEPAGLTGPLTVSDAAETVTITTGPMQVAIPKARFSPLEDVRIDANRDGRFDDSERVTAPPAPAFLVVREGDGTTLTTRVLPPDRLVVEDAGPVRCTVLIRGPLGAPDGRRRLRYVARLHFYVGQPWVRIIISLDNDILSPRMSNFTDAILRLNAPLAGTTCDFGVRRTFKIQQAPLRLLQDYDNRFLMPGLKVAGKRAPGYAYVARQPALLAFVRDFWRLYPKGFRVDGKGISVELLPELPVSQYDNERDRKLLERVYYWCDGGKYRLSSGVRVTTEVWLDFSAPSSSEPAAAEADWFQHRLFAAASPRHYCDSGAFGDLMPQRKGVFDVWNAQLAKAFQGFMKRRESVREYGFMNYGDWFGERTWNWGNMEYDTPWTLALQFVRSADLGFLWAGEPAARHSGDIDTIHDDARESNVGRVHVHCMGHTGGYFPAGYRDMGRGFTDGTCTISHTWDQGLFTYYMLTGDRGHLENARLVADQIAAYSTTNYDFRSERDCGWGLIAMMSAYRYTGDPFYLNAAHIMAATAVYKQQPDRGRWGHFIGECKHTPRHWGAKPFMTGILLKGLKLYDREAPSEHVKQAIIRCCDFLWRECWREKDLGFIYAQCSTFEDKGGPWTWTLVGEGLVYGYELRPTREHKELIVKAIQGNLYRAPCGSFGKSFTQGTIQWPYIMTALARHGIQSVEPLPEPKPPAKVLLRNEVVGSTDGTATFRAVVYNPTDQPLKCRLLLRDLPTGWTAKRGSELTWTASPGWSVGPPLVVSSKEPLTDRVALGRLVCTAGDVTDGEDAFVEPPRLLTLGARVGWLTDDEDPLLKAALSLGVEVERIPDLRAADLSPYRTIVVGDEAFNKNFAHVREAALRLQQFAASGGTVIVGQLNDEKWSLGFLPYDLVVDDAETTTGAIVSPPHPLFNRPNRIRDLRGIVSYDNIALAAGEWRALLRDESLRPSVVEANLGRGRFLVVMPSFDRQVGVDEPEDAKVARRCEQFIANLMAYAQGPP
ncbi:MAG: hypothetical protein ACE5O2_00010 [Armatimonadota bacterium]